MGWRLYPASRFSFILKKSAPLMISARLFIVSATLVFWGEAVSADSIHRRKVFLIGIEKEKANSKRGVRY